MADSPDLVHRGVGAVTDWQDYAGKLARDLERVTAELRDASERVYLQREIIAKDIAARREEEQAAFRAGYLENRTYGGKPGGAGDRITEEYIERAFHAWRMGKPL